MHLVKCKVSNERSSCESNKAVMSTWSKWQSQVFFMNGILNLKWWVGGTRTFNHHFVTLPTHFVRSHPKWWGETTKPEEQVFHQCETTKWETLRSKLFPQIEADQSESESSPCLPRARKVCERFHSGQVCVMCWQLYLFYFILFILCLFRRKRNLRINDQRELDGKFLYALHTSMCKLYLCVCCKPGELGFFGAPFYVVRGV